MTDHIDSIMAIMDAAFDPAFGEAWTRRQIEDALLRGNCRYLLIGNDGRRFPEGPPAAGFCLSRLGYDEEELLLLAVRPENRRRGLGRDLLLAWKHEAQSRGAKRLLLEMRRGNPAEALYRSFGFSQIGERKHYYRMGGGASIDAITFACDLTWPE